MSFFTKPKPEAKKTATKKKQKKQTSVKKGKAVQKRQEAKNIFADPSDFLQEHYSIQFYHVPTTARVRFKAWVTSFSDSYQSNWNTEDAYGRMDPITTFQNTTRVITIEWDVVAASKPEAISNMDKCERLFKMLYPTYQASSGDSAGSIAGAPIFKVKFGNLISTPGAPALGGVSTSGLMGTMGGFDYSPDFEAGFFLSNGAMYPQRISLSAEFQVIHNFQVGWNDETSHFRAHNYPYGARKEQQKGLETAQDTLAAMSGERELGDLPNAPIGALAPPTESFAKRKAKKIKKMTKARGKKKR